jgi:hypothetical protein
VHTASSVKTEHNREKRDFEQNSLLFLNRWRYFDVLGLLLHNFTRETLCIPHRASKTEHNLEKRDYAQNSLLFLNRWIYFDVLCQLLHNFTRETLRIPHRASNRNITEKNAILIKIRCYFSTVGDILTF